MRFWSDRAEALRSADLDAVVCAWMAVEYPAGRAVPLGDDDAAIWCPEGVVRTGKQGQGQVKQGSFADLSTQIGSSA